MRVLERRGGRLTTSTMRAPGVTVRAWVCVRVQPPSLGAPMQVCMVGAGVRTCMLGEGSSTILEGVSRS